MQSLPIKHIIFVVVLSSLIILPASISWAQGVLVSDSSDSGTSVSSPPSYLLESRDNLNTSLVDIKALEAPTMTTQDGRTGMASIEHDGHGVIIDSSGIIATNTHIIANAQHIYVELNGDNYEATVIYSSKPDISFIKIDAPFLLNPITWGDSSQLKIGNPVLALANTDAGSQTLGGEVINIVKGQHSGDDNLIELKVDLHPGDSGGPILDEQGDLLGLIMANNKDDTTQSYAITSEKIQKEFLKYQGSSVVGDSAP